MPEKPIETVLKAHTDRLMVVPGVVGTAQGECEGKPCIKILVVEKKPSLLQKLPPNLEGYPVEIVETGVIRATEPR